MNTIGIEDHHLGDGVYASYDGWHIWLDLRGQDDCTRIALDSTVLDALIAFRDDVAKAEQESQQQ